MDLMKRRVLGFALAAALCVFRTSWVYAAGPVDGGTAQFTDKGIESDFKDSDVLQEIGKLLPGGSVTVQVKLENQRSQNTDWYITSQVVRSLEESSDTARGGAYTYELLYTDEATGEVKTLYSSQSVGGGDSREGLHETDELLGDYLYLGRLGKGGTGRVSLTVALDAETLGNAYQSTLADLQMAFAAEVVSGTSGSGSSGSGGGGTTGNQGNPQVSAAFSVGSVQTGDTSSLLFWSLLAFICGLILMVLAVVSFKKGKGGRRS